MGMDDRDSAYRSRGTPPRRRPYDGDDLPARSSSSRAPHEMDSPRSRPPRRDYGFEENYDRPMRDPRSAPRGGSSGRNERDGYDRRPRPANSPRGDRRGYDGDYDRPGRPGRSDPNAPNPRGERSMRGGRPPVRDDGWGDPRGSRSGARPGSAADSNGRLRRPPQRGGRGGLWGDEAEPFGSQKSALYARDPRARRFAAQQEEEEEKGSPAAAFAKAIGAIVLALVLGAGSAYGYFIMSAPKLHVPPSQQAIPTAPASTPSTTPSASATKSALIQPSAGARALFIS